MQLQFCANTISISSFHQVDIALVLLIVCVLLPLSRFLHPENINNFLKAWLCEWLRNSTSKLQIPPSSWKYVLNWQWNSDFVNSKEIAMLKDLNRAFCLCQTFFSLFWDILTDATLPFPHFVWVFTIFHFCIFNGRTMGLKKSNSPKMTDVKHIL